jgi:hypothetical protein
MNEGSEEVNRHYGEFQGFTVAVDTASLEAGFREFEASASRSEAKAERLRSIIQAAEESAPLWGMALALRRPEEPSSHKPRMMTVHPWFRGQR